MLKAIFFDAVGTLIYLTNTVGHHYALAGADIGLKLDPHQLDDAFYSAWKKMPRRAAIAGPREDDDKGWWRELVDLVLDQVAPSLSEFDRDNFFEIAYEHFAEPGVWELYPEVPERPGAIAAAFSARRNLKFRWAFAVHPPTPGYLEVFCGHFHLQRNRSRQTGSGNFPARVEINRSQTERGPACRRRSGTRLGRQPAPPVCRSFGWIAQRIRCAIWLRC